MNRSEGCFVQLQIVIKKIRLCMLGVPLTLILKIFHLIKAIVEFDSLSPVIGCRVVMMSRM